MERSKNFFLDFLGGRGTVPVIFEPFLSYTQSENLIWRRGKHLWDTPHMLIDTLAYLTERTQADMIFPDLRGLDIDGKIALLDEIRIFSTSASLGVGIICDSADVSLCEKSSGIDCLCDSFSTLIAAFAVISVNFTTLNIDAWGGLAVSAFILLAGCKAAKDSVHLILGIAPSEEMIKAAEQIPSLFPCVKNIYSVNLHDYGADNKIITLTAEFCDDATVSSVCDVQKKIKNYILQETGCNCCLIIE